MCAKADQTERACCVRREEVDPFQRGGAKTPSLKRAATVAAMGASRAGDSGYLTAFETCTEPVHRWGKPAVKEEGRGSLRNPVAPGVFRGRGREIERMMMIRSVSLAVAGLLALAGVAVANGKGAKTYRADLAPVIPAATTASLPTVDGKAQLVDGKNGKKNNKVSLHMRGLAADTMYLWHVHVGSCAATGAPVAGWTYRTQDVAGNGTLTSNGAGNANTKGKSASFNAGAQSFSVNVHVAAVTNGLPAGTIIACGDLQRKP